jgi:hypothetical protein
MSNKNLTYGLIVVGLIAIIALFTPVGQKVVKSFGGTAPQNCGGSVTCFTDLAAGNVFMTVEQWIGGSTDATAKEQIVSTGTCNAGAFAASSTLFSVANPFSAVGTSTAEIQINNVVGQATSTTLSVSTTTSTATLAAHTSLGLINSGLVATTSLATFSSGVTAGSIGMTSAGTGTQGKLSVAPTDSIAAYATSTYTNAGALNYTPGLACTYKITWIR